MKTELTRTLSSDGIAVLPDRIAPDLLRVLQIAFANQLKYRRWNTTDGYEQNEKWRRLVEDLFIVHPYFLQVALSEPVLDALDDYFDGPHYQITEARGWETVRTKKQFHNWHNDAWYAPELAQVPRQVKLGVYLTDVETGYFSYVQGTHQDQLRPGHWNNAQVAALGKKVIDVRGPAGTMFLFDTCGIHRQSAPILSPRHALMFNYHRPNTPIQQEDTAYGRYRAVRLDAHGVANLTDRQRHILTNGYDGTMDDAQDPNQNLMVRYPVLYRLHDLILSARLQMQSTKDTLMRPLQAISRRLGGRS